MKDSLILGLLAAFLLSPLSGGVADAHGAEVPATSAKPDSTAVLAASADTPFHFGFKKSVGGQLPSIDQEGFKAIVDKHGAIFLGDTTRKDLFLTFDNGYENGYTAPILDTLKAKKVPAVFFITGHYVKDQPELVKRMAAEGHLVGNHSWSHPDMTTISDSQIKDELDRVKQASAKLTGTDRMAYLRPPRGIFSERVLRVTKELGYTNVFWSIAYKDWDVNDQKGAPYAYRKVIDQLHPGAVILLHSVSKDNAAALGAIIDEARRQGYEFRSLDDLMRSRKEKPSPASPGQPTR
ncbi:delta-lactam-biosynthetic de-N-acetylase [Paenibacillus faecis]|uniref:delta-lactam-biosynthetic de-N-acetylase n=1 Tax=Paenibacillus faecis TaxID=862114 RepID=UPI001B12757B|nr:delta-lactam-biosynthetic de-N-acetylase [Paenibacillus faecis]GIO85904.1 delta-lactam-biosynthetic de-N-acetylase [Paenibacillus faecis]